MNNRMQLIVNGIFEARDAEQLCFPATERNREAIALVLEPLLPQAGLVLEIASGSGEHLCYLQQRFSSSHPDLRWRGSDPEPAHRASIAAWAKHFGLAAMAAPLELDAMAAHWPNLGEQPALLLCINMIHIAPWAATEGLFAHGAQLLLPGNLLVLYGPFREVGLPLSPSNQAFENSLQERDPSWGLRCLGEVSSLAQHHGFELFGRWPMPANNLTVAFQRC
ncbi:DUF938 domain-containing protein [Synechococcus lacustris]|uniref:DUF938 domain-containing protein n=1 Tax=Synechococcus lacustris TaxID=2116544 RepID=UPI00333E2AFE